MSKPRVLDAYSRESETITAVESDYAIAVEWSDSNPNAEDRVGYFVSSDTSSNKGLRIVKATNVNKVLGVTVANPGFSTNVTESMCDSSNDLLSKFSYVSIAGFATVRDNGSCTVNGMCVPSSAGIAVATTKKEGYRVVSRIDSNHVMVHLDPVYTTLSISVSGTTLVIA